ncbi:unnamed protein product [Paramecium sonneborni]|uniref:Uncharacterized protein n=1 Tax=Paramecium sonneborni TaxID=65129 RepID=A0A8S1MY78_9CILI|nr:unnamed protein product [Paramecium sonneborni]
MEWLDLPAEDEDYSCEQHLTYVKRRISITHIKDNIYIQTNDPALIRQLALNNKVSSQKSGRIIFLNQYTLLFMRLKIKLKRKTIQN